MMAKRKRKVGRPRSGLNEMIAIRWQPWLLKGIDTYGRKHLLDRSSALRHIVTSFLTKEGLVDPDAMYQDERDAQTAG